MLFLSTNISSRNAEIKQIKKANKNNETKKREEYQTSNTTKARKHHCLHESQKKIQGRKFF